MSTYMVCNAEGYAETDGLQEHEARMVAQRIANDKGESVWLSQSDSDEMGEEIVPEIEAFLGSADSRETSDEIMEAIAWLASGNFKRAVRIWEDPTEEERLAIWEYVTKNGLHPANGFFWGAAGRRWASEIGRK